MGTAVVVSLGGALEEAFITSFWSALGIDLEADIKIALKASVGTYLGTTTEAAMGVSLE